MPMQGGFRFSADSPAGAGGFLNSPALNERSYNESIDAYST